MAEAPRLREAGERDLAAILAITNEAIAHTTALWMTQALTMAQRAEWFAQRRVADLPVLVAVDDADVALAFASYGPFRPYDGYRLTVEHSVYVAPAAQGRGIGRALLDALIDRASAQGLHVMIGAIAADNLASIAMHRRAGFVEGPVLPQVGRKFDRWLDLMLMYRRLDRPTPEQASS